MNLRTCVILLGILTCRFGVHMIELAYYNSGLRFFKLKYPYELDKLKIGRFDYFNKHLGMNDYMGNFSSWLKRQSVTLIVGIDNVTIVGWVMAERWKQNAKDGHPVYVLRAIEVSPSIARTGIGRTLFVLSFKACPGHMLTKPVNSVAKTFFLSLGFQEPDRNCPVDLSSYPGYLFLPEAYELQSIPHELIMIKGGLVECQNETSVKDILRPAFTLNSLQDAEVTPEKEDTLIRSIGLNNIAKAEPKAETDCNCAGYSKLSSIPVIADVADQADSQSREFLKEHKMMTSCCCGEYMTHKYVVSGSSRGFLFVCTSCGKERYFLKNQ
ncbi:hypothetical protein Metho_0876 [Methanomethylovorans hollandica DSM 15978]|uniref:N-acetyltransferase domain-containing protein n=2 Tax=Methanomethylovorans hollandica TaxID=101192 RepID=L0KYP8_METHD|nr:hypothetical protein Metho_0876 [Methanomethylovorans hollandica DSM 15978]